MSGGWNVSGRKLTSFSLAMIARTERIKSYHRQFEERLYSLPIRRPDGKATVMMEGNSGNFPGKNLTDPTFFLPAPIIKISLFISQLTPILEPIFRVLRKNSPIIWNEDCQRAFDKIKAYLANPPVLVPPKPGRPLLMYIATFEFSMGCILGQHDETGKKEQVIYYLSKRMTDYETRYPEIEKVCLTLVWAVQRLRHYMLCYTVYLLAKFDPLRYIFEKPVLTGRLSTWQMILLILYDI